MTSFGYWQNVAAQSGRFMCEICFDGFPLEGAWMDESGQRWTLCRECGIREEESR